MRTAGKQSFFVVVLACSLVLAARQAAGELKEYTVKPGDSLWRISRKFRNSVAYLKNINRLQSDIIHPGQTLRVYTLPIRIVVKKKQFKLCVFSGKRLLAEYPIAIGKNGATPDGIFKIKTKVVNPDWWDPETKKRIKFGDPRHAIGTRWMGFERDGLGIHGTNEPESIGTAASRGCIRMLKADLEELFAAAPRGTVVEIRDE